MIRRSVGCFGVLLCLVPVTQKLKFTSFGMVGFQDSGFWTGGQVFGDSHFGLAGRAWAYFFSEKFWAYRHAHRHGPPQKHLSKDHAIVWPCLVVTVML